MAEDTADDDAEFDYIPQANQSPHTVIEGDVVDLVGPNTSGEQTGTSFGVVYENPEVVTGTVWLNRNVPDGFVSTREINDTIKMAAAEEGDYVGGIEVEDGDIEDARDRLEDYVAELDDFEAGEWDAMAETNDYGVPVAGVNGTDIKIADPSDAETEVQEVNDTVLGIEINGSLFSGEEGELPDRVMVWYNSLSGQFLGRALDFNGLPFAGYDANGSQTHGLFQVANGWREANRSKRGEMASNGKAPRVVRPPILRDDIDDIAVEIYRSGQAYYINFGHAQDDYSEIIDGDESFESIDFQYAENAAETIASEFDDDPTNWYEDDGWNEGLNLDNKSEGGSSDGSSFDIDVNEGDDDDPEHPTDNEVEFANMVVEKIEGTGADPADAIFGDGDEKTDLEGLVAANEGNFDVTPDVAAIDATIRENASHLTA
jgi:hypothetical protein